MNSMFYPDSRNPRDVRAQIDNARARYIHGDTLFPGVRLTAPAESFARKSRPVAAMLAADWAVIDEDRAYFREAVVATFDAMTSLSGKSVLVATCVGRNVVNVARLVASEPRQATVSTWPRTEFVQAFQDHSFTLSDGGNVALRDGVVHGDLQGVVVRRSNESGLFGFAPGAAAQIVAQLGNASLNRLDG